LGTQKIKHNYFKSTQKTLQNTLFLEIPKWVFISGPDQLTHEKIIEKRPKNHMK
jgi:hypothetical protein